MRQPPIYAAPASTASFITAGLSKTAVATWQAGDTVLVVGLGEVAMNGWNGAPPTATGLTFTALQETTPSGSIAAAGMWTATAAAAGSAVTITKAIGDASPHWGFLVYVFHNCEGVGTAVMQTTATRTVSITPTRRKSLLLWAVGDFAAAALVAETPTAHVDRLQLRDTSHYTVYVEEFVPVRSFAPVPVGVGGAGTGPFSIVAVEVFGSGRDEVPFRSRGMR